MNPPPFLWPRTKTEPMWTPCPSPWAVLRNLLPLPCSLKARLFYESRIIGLGASIDALEKNGNAEWITPKYPPTTPTSEQKKATLDKTELEAYVAIVTGTQPADPGGIQHRSHRSL